MSSPFRCGTRKLPAGHAGGQCVRMQTNAIKVDCRAAARPAGGCTTRWDLKTGAYRTIVPFPDSACGSWAPEGVEQDLDIAALAHVRSSAPAFRFPGNLFAIGQEISREAKRRGAAAYVCKGCDIQILFDALRSPATAS